MEYDTTRIQMILNLSDDSVEVTSVEETENSLIAYVQKKEVICFCDQCGSKMESKGPRYRKVNHPILQDGRALQLMVKTRKWYCNSCNIYRYDSFNFVEKYNQSSNLTILMILEQLKDLNLSFVQIAKNMNVSDTTIHETFMRFVDIPRLPLCRVLCIDEVYLKFDADNLYSVVLMNWETGDIIDILPNRFKSTLESYLCKIPRDGRNVVEYLVSDKATALREARTLAIKNAQDAAALLAGASGCKVNSVLEIREDYTSAGRSNDMMFKAVAMEAGGAATPIVEGNITITSNVTVKYELTN